VGWLPVQGEDRQRHLEALRRSDMEAMLGYYKQNYPREANTASPAPFPRVQAPVLMIHGLDDQAILPGGLNGTWEWVGADLTIVTLPGAGHFVQHDAAQAVTDTVVTWLRARSPALSGPADS
jgi:epoxide hydrolase 4